LLTGFVAAGSSEISVQKTGSYTYDLTLKSSSINDVANAQAQLIPKARELCGTHQVELGRYTFEGVEKISAESSTSLDTFILIQQISCSKLQSSSPSNTSIPVGPWSPSDAEKESVEKAAHSYLTARSSGPYAEAYGLLSAFLKESSSLENWSIQADAASKKRGGIEQVSIKKITWYKDPPSAPSPGIYAASDYATQFKDGSYVCGYIAWYKKDDGSFEIIREESGELEAATISQLSEVELHAVKSRFGC
jgi:hypothetical protein